MAPSEERTQAMVERAKAMMNSPVQQRQWRLEV